MVEDRAFLNRINLCSETAMEIGPDDLERIVVMSGLGALPVGGRRHTLFRIVEFGGRPYKVRAYRSPIAAQRQLDLTRKVSHLFPSCYGRIEHCLIWEYAKDHGRPQERVLSEDIAGFLAELSNVPSEPLTAEVLDRWCDDLNRVGIFRPSSIDRIRDYFAEVQSEVRHWNYEYLDAVPKNFIYDASGRLLSIDGKHLFPGPRGLSLLKLFCHRDYLLPEKEYRAIADRYLSQVDCAEYNQPRYFDFLMFYYCMVLLAENAHYISRRHNLESNRNRWRKQKVLQIVRAPIWLCLFEGTRSSVPYYAMRMKQKVVRLLELATPYGGSLAG